jgi:alpha-tubulin suppressor-like RCC1 family protein
MTRNCPRRAFVLARSLLLLSACYRQTETLEEPHSSGDSTGDVDQCREGTVGCDRTHGTCTKTDDGYECGCQEGWELSADGKTCLGTFELISLSAGRYHTCGIKTDGTVACWVSAGESYTCGLTADSTIVCWGNDHMGKATPPNSEFEQVSAGGIHTCGITAEGATQCWGDNRNGQSTPPGDRFEQVAAGHTHTCGITEDGDVLCWGLPDYTPPTGIFEQISANRQHSCGVTTDGTVLCWGADWDGQSTSS